MFTLKERKKIKDYLKNKGVEIMAEPGYSCTADDEFYKSLMDKYGLIWYHGEILEPERYAPDLERLWRWYKGL